ncbi:MAG: FAD-dependent oxidoreductase [Candidatus Pacearchaeota archaeon]
MKSVVIIGGGFAGAETTKYLEKYRIFKTILIDNKDYFEFTPSILRAFVNPNKINKIRVKHKDYLKNTEIVVGNVIDVDKKFVYVKKERIKYSYLVIATGSKYYLPIKGKNLIIASSLKQLMEKRDLFLKSKNVTIIGGGLVGVELAGEIINNFPEKKISIVESGGDLISRNHKRSINYATNFLKRNNVEIFLNQRATRIYGNNVITNKGEKIFGNVVFLSTGIKPNSDIMKKNFGESLDDKGYIKVNQNLKVEGLDNVFSIGDVSNFNEEKTAQAAEKQAKIISRNLYALEMKKPLEIYKPVKRPILISLGKYNGIFEYKGIILGGVIPALMKYIVEIKTLIRFRKI